MSRKSKIKFTCSDGRELSGLIYPAKSDAKAAVLVAGATGMRKEFYASFCEFLSSNNYSVLVFDFRGVGESSLKDLKADTSNIIDWGLLDMAAALDELIRQFPGLKYHIVGHSAGGQLTGLMHNHNKISSQFNFACSTGQLSNLKFMFWLKAIFFMKFFIPFSNLVYGYAKLELVKMGGSIPKNVAKQWCDWCCASGYIKESIGKEIKEHYFDKLQHNILWSYTTDDTIANLKNVKNFIEIHSNNKNDLKELVPKKYGMKSIGHMGFFKKRKSKLWKEVTAWLEKH